MRIAFAVVSLFAGGGLQRDCLEIAKLVQDLGHDVVIYTSRLYNNALSDDIPIVVLQNNALTNHGRQRTFATDFLNEVSGRVDLVVGFDKLIGLDVLYCADPSMRYRVLRRPYLGLLPRYRTFASIEGESFSNVGQTKAILLSQNQLSEYWSAWNTRPDRLALLPPTLNSARRKPEYRVNGVRERHRSQLNLDDSDWVWISIAVKPRIKGLDRVMRALTYFPKAKLLIAGLNETNRLSERIARRTRAMGVSSRVKWLGHREDIAQLMAAADLLVHPARYDTTGTVILEAIVNGLPVVTTAVCGYAMHVDAAGAGIVVREPFDYPLFLAALDEARDQVRRQLWSASGVEYGKKTWLYEGRQRAAEIIVAAAHEKQRGRADEGVLSDGRPRQGAVVPLKSVAGK